MRSTIVYYDNETGLAHSCTAKPASVFGETLHELQRSVTMISRALEEPVLEMNMFAEATSRARS